MNSFADLYRRLDGLNASTWHTHESYVARLLNIRTDECNTAFDELSSFISQLKKGGVGVKGRSFVANEDGGQVIPAIDLADTTSPNSLNVWFIRFGTYAEFATSPVKSKSPVKIARPRFFQLGTNTIDIRRQMEIVDTVTGAHSSIANDQNGVGLRRQASWRSWANNESSGRSYHLIDLPMIMDEFADELGIDENDCMEEHTDAAKKRAKKIIVDMLHRSNAIELRSARSPLLNDIDAESSGAEGGKKAGPSTPKRRRKGDRTEDECARSDDAADKPKSINAHLKLDVSIDIMREVIAAGGLDGIRQLGAVEISLLGLDEKKRTEVIAADIISRGGSADNRIIDWVEKLNPRDRRTLRDNLVGVKKSIGDAIPHGLFQPKDDQLLLDYIDDGQRYSAGERLRAKLFIPVQNSSRMLTDTAAQCIRSILFNYNVPLSRFPGLMNCFAVLLLGIALGQTDLPSIATIRTRTYRLQEIDRKRFGKKHSEKFAQPDEYGYYRLWYTSADDAQHARKFDKRHVLLMSSMDDDGQPFFDLLTASGAHGKTSDANSDLNVDVMTSTLPLAGAALYGGNTSDNANDALLEGVQTFDKMMQFIAEADEANNLPFTSQIYGVERRAVTFGDPFHIDNLIMKWASIGFGGETERGNHQMMHHRQLLQNLHSIHTDDPVLSQAAADAVLADKGASYRIRTSRERQERWLVNQRHAARVIEGLELLGDDLETSFWVQWARYLHERSDGWKRRSLGETILMFLKPDIIVGLHFEAELKNYFETTYEWHANPGELSTRPGFRVMEYHQLYFEFIAPFWQMAKETPEKTFPKTFEYLGSITDVEVQNRKTQQIGKGIEGACDSLAKHSSIALSAPLLFLVLTHPNRGRNLLRAALAIASEAGLVEGDGWGRHQYDNPEERPASEKIFYDKMLQAKEDAVHWYQQIGLHRPVVQAELKKLSIEEIGARPVESSFWLGDFRKEYPILFAALAAVFRYMPSNSRLTESMHGDMRNNKKDSHTWRWTDARQQFMGRPGYQMREERRKFIRRMAKERGHKSNNTSVKHENTNELAEMVGTQLLETLKAFSFCKLYEDFGDLLVTELSVSSIANQDYSMMEKKITAKKMEAVEKKRQAKTSAPITLEKWREDAANMVPDNDVDWTEDGAEDEKKRLERLAKMSGPNYWNKDVTPLNPTFYDETKEVLPYLWKDEMAGKRKKELMVDLRAHLDLIKSIAEGEAPNSLSPEINLAGMSKEQIMLEFIKVDKSIVLEANESAYKERIRLNNSIIDSCSSGIADRKRYGREGIVEEEEDTDVEYLSG